MKKIIEENHQVVVHPDTRTNAGCGPHFSRALQPGEAGYNEEMRERTEAIRDQILRHVDGLALSLDNRTAPGAVEVKFDTREVCAFCDLPWNDFLTQEMVDKEGLLYWTEDSVHANIDGVGLPMCCDKAQEEWRREMRIALRIVPGGKGVPADPAHDPA